MAKETATSQPNAKSAWRMLPYLFLVIALAFAPNARQYVQDIRRFATSQERNGIESYECIHRYSVEIMSFDPVVMYIDGFLSDFEITHLVDSYGTNWRRSEFFNPDLDRNEYDPAHRQSKSARVPVKDLVSQCIMNRTKSLLGNLQHESIEALQMVKYETGGEFRLHYDWFDTLLQDDRVTGSGANRPAQRLGTIFVYLEDKCTGGETYFPDIRGVGDDADGEKFARTDTGDGLLVRPKKGNGIFWNNMHMNGTGDMRLVHAGLPIQDGIKIGMNIFTTYYPDSPIIG